MSKHITDFDLDDMSEDDLAYFDQRPWLKQEYELQTGNPFSEIDPRTGDQAEDDEEDFDSSNHPEDYNDWEYKDLQKEIASRNKDREDDEKIVLDGRKQEDLVRVLEADDEANPE